MSEINWTVFDFMQPRNWVKCLLEPACGGISFFFRSMNLSKSSCEFPNYEWTLNYFCDQCSISFILKVFIKFRGHGQNITVGEKHTKSPYQKYGLFQAYKRTTIDTKRTLLIIKNE